MTYQKGDKVRVTRVFEVVSGKLRGGKLLVATAEAWPDSESLWVTPEEIEVVEAKPPTPSARTTSLSPDDFLGQADGIRVNGMRPLFLPTGLRLAVAELARQVWHMEPSEEIKQVAAQSAKGLSPRETAAYLCLGLDSLARRRLVPELVSGGMDDDEWAAAFAAACLACSLECRLVTWEASRNCWRMGVAVCLSRASRSDGSDADWALYTVDGLQAGWPHPRWETDQIGTRSPLVTP